MSDAKLVTVYSPDGAAEQHTRQNARDLVNGANYSWDPKVSTTPAGLAPFAVPPNKKFKNSKAQEVLDRVGGKNATVDEDEVEGDEAEADEAPAEVAEADEGEGDAEVEADADPAPTPPARRSRGK